MYYELQFIFLNIYFTACVISSEIKETLRFSLFAMISIGIMLSIPLTLQIFFFTFPKYGIQTTKKQKLIIKIKTINLIVSIWFC